MFTANPRERPRSRGEDNACEEWLAGQAAGYSRRYGDLVYSDSQNDLPLLEYVPTTRSRGRGKNPDEVLRREAVKRGWQVISLE